MPVVLGFALVLLAPLISTTPVFTPPDGCPPCPNFPTVTYPYIWPGLGVGAVGLVLLVRGAIKLNRVPHKSAKQFGPIVALAGLGLVGVGPLLSGVMISGNGWAIGLYGLQGYYLTLLGISAALFGALTSFTNWKSAILLAAGLVIAGFSVFVLAVNNSELELRCSIEVGCNPILARGTNYGSIMMGIALATGTFLIGCALGFAKKKTS